MGKFNFSKKSHERMITADPRLVEIAMLAIKISKVDFGIPEFGGKRTHIEQRELFDRGASKCDGTRLKSKHQSGLALDVYAYVDGKASWDTGHLTSVAVAMLQAANRLGYKLSWGGLWTRFVDMPHFELLE